MVKRHSCNVSPSKFKHKGHGLDSQ